MNKIRAGFVLILIALILFLGCHQTRDDSKQAWYPHQPTSWVTTPGGHLRDAGPFDSVQGGFVTDLEIDGAVDAAFLHFLKLFPQFQLSIHPIALNDDYTLWAPNPGGWASGLETTGVPMLNVCLWSRIEGSTPAAGAFIARSPGNYWGVYYANWRWTAKPLAPAIEHELLHSAISDPNHSRAEWATLNADPRMKAVQDRCAFVSGLDRF